MRRQGLPRPTDASSLPNPSIGFAVAAEGGEGASLPALNVPRPSRFHTVTDHYCEECYALAPPPRPGRRALCAWHRDLELALEVVNDRADQAWSDHKEREQ